MVTVTGIEKRWFIHNLAVVHPAGDDICLVEMLGRKGDMPPLHAHGEEDEMFFVLEGRMSIFVGGDRIDLAAGESAYGPRGIPHTYRVESELARWLTICAPAGFERFVVAASEPAPADELPPADREVDHGELARLAEAHGIEILGPPGLLPA